MSGFDFSFLGDLIKSFIETIMGVMKKLGLA